MKTILLIAASMLLFQAGAIAKEKNPFKVDGSVWLVKTSGLWKQNNQHGYYRVIVTRSVGEHAEDNVYVQILKNKLEHLKTVKLNTPGYKGYVRNVSFNNISSTKMAISIEIEMKAMYGIKQKDLYIINPNGEFKKVINAKGINL